MGLENRFDFFAGVWVRVGLGKSVSNYNSFFESSMFIDVFLFFDFFSVVLARVLVHVLVRYLMDV